MHRVVACTALALVVPAAATADVRSSGDARLGLRHNGGAAVATTLEKRFTLNFDGATTTDGGVTLGGRVRIRSEANAGSGLSGARVFARMAGFTVAAGNIDGAMDKMPGIFVDGVGLTGLGKHGVILNVAETGERDRHGDWDAFSSTGNGAEGIEVIGKVGPVAFHASYSGDGLRGIVGPRARFALHAAGDVAGFSLAAAWQDSAVASEDKLAVTVARRFGRVDVTLGHAVNGWGAAQRIDKTALTLGAGTGPWRFDAYVAHQGFASAIVTHPTTWGLGAAYDLGGSAKVQAGLEGTTVGTIRADVGVSFRF